MVRYMCANDVDLGLLSTYRYTAYGQPDAKGTTGDDANIGAKVVNP